MQNPPAPKLIFATLIFIQVLFGINFSTSKVIVTELSPYMWSNLRFLIAGLILGLIALVMGRPHPKLSKEFLLPLIPLSLLGMSVGQTLFMYGLKFTSSINTAVITTTIPILTMAVAIIRKKESMSLSKVMGVPLALIGVLTLKGVENLSMGLETLKGDLLVLSASFCFALSLNFTGDFIRKFDNFWSTAWMFMFSGVLMAVFNLNEFTSIAEFRFNSTFIFCALFSIIGATILTYVLNNWALTKAASGNVALFIYLQPVVATIIGVSFLGEEITTRFILSSLCIFIGVLITLRRTA